eukprot:GFUD01010270.1.p1 GENE.GFUD01010270.1~~GFUD01010270.1.p1  ORF type:complete len:248 (+),score=46.41 GFUD01010270.1:92-835(+)
MFSGLLGSVPFFWKVPVLLVFVVLLMFVMILFAGYKVRLPLFLGEIGPASVPASNLALEEQIRDLKSMIGHIKSGQAAVDGRTENCLQFDPKDSRLSRQSSGIEELVPLGYDCHEKNHPKEKSLPAICGTPKKSKTNLILTPVKARVMSQPDIHHNPLNFPADEPNSENQILDLTRKRSDSFPKSPVKNLLAEGCESPRSTEFRWVSTEDKEEADEQTVPKEILICEDNRSEFLNKVEEVFKSTDEE